MFKQFKEYKESMEKNAAAAQVLEGYLTELQIFFHDEGRVIAERGPVHVTAVKALKRLTANQLRANDCIKKAELLDAFCKSFRGAYPAYNTISDEETLLSCIHSYESIARQTSYYDYTKGSNNG